MKRSQCIASFIRREIRQECTPDNDSIVAGVVSVFGLYRNIAENTVKSMRITIAEESKAAGEFPIA